MYIADGHRRHTRYLGTNAGSVAGGGGVERLCLFGAKSLLGAKLGSSTPRSSWNSGQRSSRSSSSWSRPGERRQSSRVGKGNTIPRPYRVRSAALASQPSLLIACTTHSRNAQFRVRLPCLAGLGSVLAALVPSSFSCSSSRPRAPRGRMPLALGR